MAKEPISHRIVCIPCGLTCEIRDIGCTVVEMFGEPPQPYKLWSADRAMCKNCGSHVLYGMPLKAFAEHHEKDFVERLADIVRDTPETVFVWFEKVEHFNEYRDPLRYLAEWVGEHEVTS